jgi:hypothetical protein
LATAKATKQKGCCYISTAACCTRGLADDCDELQTHRRFRDEALLVHPLGRRLVSRYFETAPGVAAAIDRHPERRTIYDRIFTTYVVPAEEAARKRDTSAGIAILEEVLAECSRRSSHAAARISPVTVDLHSPRACGGRTRIPASRNPISWVSVG